MTRWHRITLRLVAAASLVSAVLAGVAWFQAKVTPNFCYRTASADTLRTNRFGFYGVGDTLNAEWYHQEFRTHDAFDEELKKPSRSPGFHLGTVYFMGFNPSEPPTLPHRLQFYWFDGSYDFGSFRQRAIVLKMPFWFFITTCLILPAVEVRLLIRERRAARRALNGVCPQCGYDLRATPDRCPECGRETTPVSAPGKMLE